MSKRILFFLINMNLGGTEKSFLNLIDSLPTDVEVDLLLLESKGQLLEHLPGRINLRIIEENKSVNFLIQNSLLLYAIYCLKKLDIFQMLRAIFFYGKSKLTKRSDFKFETISNRLPMRSEKYDIAVAYAGPHNFISSYVAKKTVAKKKIQWIHFDVSKINYNKKSSETLYQYFDEIKVVSKKAKTQFLKFFPKLNSKTEVFYNVLNKDAIQ